MSMSAALHRPESMKVFTSKGTHWIEVATKDGDWMSFFFDSPTDMVQHLHRCLDAALELEKAAAAKPTGG